MTFFKFSGFALVLGLSVGTQAFGLSLPQLATPQGLASLVAPPNTPAAVKPVRYAALNVQVYRSSQPLSIGPDGSVVVGDAKNELICTKILKVPVYNTLSPDFDSAKLQIPQFDCPTQIVGDNGTPITVQAGAGGVILVDQMDGQDTKRFISYAFVKDGQSYAGYDVSEMFTSALTLGNLGTTITPLNNVKQINETTGVRQQIKSGVTFTDIVL